MEYDKIKKSHGATLIELIVAVAVFAIFIGAISGLLVSGIQAQRRILATQDLLNQATFILEYMGRAIRMAVKDVDGDCIGQNANFWVFETQYEDPDYPTSGDGIRFIKATSDFVSPKKCQEFYLSGNVLYEGISSDEQAGGIELKGKLISGNVKITSFNIQVSGDLSGPLLDPESPNRQPMVTISFELEGKETSLGQPRIRIQTSISQRSIDLIN